MKLKSKHLKTSQGVNMPQVRHFALPLIILLCNFPSVCCVQAVNGLARELGLCSVLCREIISINCRVEFHTVPTAVNGHFTLNSA